MQDSNRFSEWERSINAYVGILDPRSIPDPDDAIVAAGIYAFAEMLQTISTGLKAKETWEHYRFGICGSAVAQKTGQRIWIGACPIQQQYFMQCDIICPSHIKKMPDQFWRLLVELGDYGELSYQASRTSVDAKSAVFNLVDAFLQVEEQDAERRKEEPMDFTEDDEFMDFGSLEVCWPWSTAIPDLYAAATEVFQRMYKAGYMLYRHEYTLRKSREKSQSTTATH